ncbi:MAG TPA: hypothetical protein ENG03_08215 [Thioploca sp.]|nr:MAG: hypothetical protein DRR08_11885 [Gammaproteobacteria bacterium]HDN27062.1 hypothetical protein [Thioploca sp.]
MKLRITLWCTALALFISSSATSSFDLFEPDRGKPPPPPPKKFVPKPTTTSRGPLTNPFVRSHKLPPERKRPPKRKKRPPPQKDFELRGTSRIGAKQAVILKGPDNKEFIQYFRSKKKEPTPTGNIGVKFKEPYQDYFLLSVESRKIQIEYPTESPCRKSNDKKGVECNSEDGGKTAILSLVHGKALKAPAAHKKPPKKRADDKKKKRQRTFKRQVIKDEDVPPGMRVVRTPFGDRLVPIKK